MSRSVSAEYDKFERGNLFIKYLSSARMTQGECHYEDLLDVIPRFQRFVKPARKSIYVIAGRQERVTLERELATCFAVFPYIQGVTEPIKRILNSHNVKVTQNLFRVWGIFSPNLRILSRKNNEPTPFILFLAMTVTTNTSDRPNVSLVHV